jgi:hypothetical protein
MRDALALLTAPALLLSLAACGGSGPGNDPPPPPPGGTIGVTALEPDAGPGEGGTLVTLTGHGFSIAGTLKVRLRGTDVGPLTVLSDGSLTFTTPSGAPGLADLVLLTDLGDFTLSQAFAYGTPPLLTGVTPIWGYVGENTPVTVTGVGFAQPRAGVPTVRFGQEPALSVTVANDTTITCLSPGGAPGVVGVTVTNVFGTQTLRSSFTFLTPTLYAADGKAGTAGLLYAIDPSVPAVTLVGPLPLPVTALAVAPDGTLYGAVGSAATLPNALYTIDRVTAVMTLVGSLGNRVVPDMGFLGNRLIGWDKVADVCVEIDEATGAVTVLGGAVIPTGGLGLDASATGTIHFAPHRNNGALFTVNPVTGVATAGPGLGGTVGGGTFAALAWFQGTLYAVESAATGTASSFTRLVTIQPANGAVTPVVVLPPGVDALAGTHK